MNFLKKYQEDKIWKIHREDKIWKISREDKIFKNYREYEIFQNQPNFLKEIFLKVTEGIKLCKNYQVDKKIYTERIEFTERAKADF